MIRFKHILFAAILLAPGVQAHAIDLDSYPSDMLGSQNNAKASLLKGPAMCKLSGVFYQNGSEVNYAGIVKLNHTGSQDSAGFGHYSSPAGRESFVQYSVPYSIDNGNGTFTEGGISCLHALDTENSKYAINKYGVGVAELHWNVDANNPGTCPAFVDQMSFTLDRNGHLVSTRINDAETTTKGAQEGDCWRSY